LAQAVFVGFRALTTVEQPNGFKVDVGSFVSVSSLKSNDDRTFARVDEIAVSGFLCRVSVILHTVTPQLQRDLIAGNVAIFLEKPNQAFVPVFVGECVGYTFDSDAANAREHHRVLFDLVG
jgi:hypothetical protein